MLRYKNSLLERILLEKSRLHRAERLVMIYLKGADGRLDIDVQAELKSKTDQHSVPATHQPGIQASPIQRAVIHRHAHARRTGSAGGPKGLKSQSSQTSMVSDQSVRSHPTPPLPTSSPIKTKSSMSSLQSGFSGGIYPQSQQHPHPPLKPRHQGQGTPGVHPPNSSGSLQGPPPRPSANGGTKGNEMGNNPPGSLSDYYPPQFHSHIEQLGKLSRPFIPFLFNRASLVLG